jgi:hypothetical protein
MTQKVDFKKDLDCYLAARNVLRVLDVPELQYLMIDGSGDPNTAPMFAAAVEALYPLSYALKFASKRELDRDYVVMPLEGLWWADDMDAFTTARDKARWDWTLLIMTPDWIDDAMFGRAVEAVATKSNPARLGEVRLESLAEGRCVQALHIGSYDDETSLLRRMHEEYIPAQGLRMTGRHHEIYLSDARKVAPEKRRTILRQPVE